MVWLGQVGWVYKLKVKENMSANDITKEASDKVKLSNYIYGC